jgi:hypothetical protein
MTEEPTKARLAWVDADGRVVPEDYAGPYDAECDTCGTRPPEGVTKHGCWFLCPDCLDDDLDTEED